MSSDGINGQFITNILGVVTGTFATAQFPDIPCTRAMLKARSNNAGSFFIGTENIAIKLPWELDASQETLWLDIPNLNVLYHNMSSGSSDMLAYWVQR